MPKATPKKTKKPEVKIDKDEIKKKFIKASDEVVKKANWLKKKFDDADVDTRRKIVAGLSAAAAALVVLSKIGKSKKKQ